MGLDMYLEAERLLYDSSRFVEQGLPVPPESHAAKEIAKIAGAEDWLSADSPFVRVAVTVGYWRKVNAVHAWFVRECAGGVDQCQRIDVDESKLRELRVICQTVLEDRSRAEELLPPQSGFFFGGTDLDAWYWQGVERTVEILDKTIARIEAEPGRWDINYRASW